MTYEGKPVSAWLDNGFEDASRVLYELGPTSATFVFEKLRREHPKYGRRARYQSVWEKLPAWCRPLLPRPKPAGFDEWRACHALLAIGPSVIPLLGDSLGDGSFLVRSVSAETLVHFHERGRTIKAAYPALKRALHDSDPGVRKLARQALSGFEA